MPNDDTPSASSPPKLSGETVEALDFESLDFESSDGVGDLITRFGGLRPFASSLDIAVGTVQGWKKRHSIPTAHRARIRELLASMAAEGATGGVAGSTTTAQTAFDEAASDEAGFAKIPESASPSSTPASRSEPPSDSPSEPEKKLKQEEETIEEGIVGAFTSGSDSLPSSDQDSGLDISSEMWEHASLPRSTSGQWAILLSCIALLGVLTRPLWSERIDAKLMAAIQGNGHDTPSHAQDSSAQDSSAQDSSDSSSGHASDATQPIGDGGVTSNLQERLQRLEQEVSSIGELQDTPAATELRRLKSESSALAAAFDNQAARLDSFGELLARRSETLTGLNSRIARVEQSRTSARLAQRLSALFQVDNLAHAIAQNTFGDASGDTSVADFSANSSLESLEQAIEQALPTDERAALTNALATLAQAHTVSSPRRLLADYRLLLPELLTLRARMQSASLAEKLRAQLSTTFFIRRRDATAGKDPFLRVEQLLADRSTEQAAKVLRQAMSQLRNNGDGSVTDGLAENDLGEGGNHASIISRLASFESALAARNSVFSALDEIRQKLISSVGFSGREGTGREGSEREGTEREGTDREGLGAASPH